MHLSGNQIVWGLTLAFTICVAFIDGRTHRIPNWLTVAGFFSGIVIHAVFGGAHAAWVSFEGACLGLLVLFPLVLLRAVGAGDWKLMGAIGALVGPLMLWFVLLASALAAGLMAVVLVIRARRVKETLRNMATLLMGFFTLGIKTGAEISLDTPGLLKLPFGVAAAIGTFVCFVAAQWRL